METVTKYPRRMSRPPWSPNADQRRLLVAVKRAHAKKAQVDAEYKKALADAAAAEIPILHIANEIGVERKTVYRNLGRSMT